MAGLIDSHALVIGIADYQHITKLPRTNDAQHLYQLLIDSSRCGYPRQNVQLLMDGQATQAAILQALAGLARRCTEESTVLLYFSGHGGRIEEGAHAGVYLLPVDTIYPPIDALPSTAISGEDFTAALQKIPAQKVVVIFDCCHAGGLGQLKSGASERVRDIISPPLTAALPAKYYNTLAQRGGCAILASSRTDEYSYVLHQEEYGLFTKYLLDGLRGNACRDGLIRPSDLFEYLQPRVTQDHPGQHPILKLVIEENFPIARCSSPGKENFPIAQYSGKRHELRSPVNDFVGRKAERKQLTARLRRLSKGNQSVAIICGMGGVGKTQLANKVAQDLKETFPEQVLIELRGSTDQPLEPEQALQALIRSLEHQGELPTTREDLEKLYRSVLTGKRVLILADSAAHRKQVVPLLPPPGCALLITTRMDFILDGIAAPLKLHQLAAGEAVGLLRKICPRIGDHAPRIAELCGYIPLALRVTGSLLATNPPLRVEHVMHQLADQRTRLGQLRDPSDPGLDMEAVLRTSYNQLDEPARTTFAQLSVFPVSFDADAAKQIVTGVDDVDAALRQLCQHSLLDWVEETRRYDLHNLVRTFAALELPASEQTNLQRRHLAYYLGRAEEWDHIVQGFVPQQEEAPQSLALQQHQALQHLETEHDQLRAALRQAIDDWQDAALSLRLCAALWRFWWMRGYLREGLYTRLEPALSLNGEVAPDLRIEALHGACMLAYAIRDYARAELWSRECISRAQARGDVRGEVNARAVLGMTLVDQSSKGPGQKSMDAGLAELKQSATLCETLSDRWLLAWVYHNLAQAELARGNYPEMLRWLQESLELCKNMPPNWLSLRVKNLENLVQGDHGQCNPRIAQEEMLEQCKRLGDKVISTHALYTLMKLAYNQGDYPKAHGYNEERKTIEEQLVNTEGIANAIAWRGWIAAAQGRYAHAADQLAQSLKQYEGLGHRKGRAEIHAWLGMIAAEQGEYPVARRHLRQSLALRDDGPGRAYTYLCLGEVCYRQGRYRLAEQFNRKRLKAEQENNNPQGEAHALSWLGWILGARGNYAAATTQLQQSLTAYNEQQDRLGQARVHRLLGILARDQRDYPAALRHLHTSLQLYEEFDVTANAAALHRWLGIVTRDMGHTDLAETHFNDSLMLSTKLEMKQGQAHAHRWLGVVACDEGDYPVAAAQLATSLTLYDEMGLKPAIVRALEEFARLAVVQHRLERAAQLFGAAEALRGGLRLARLSVDEAAYRYWREKAYETLDETAFKAAYRHGYALPLRDAILYALEATAGG